MQFISVGYVVNNISYRCARLAKRLSERTSVNCMQDTFARATHSAGQARRATIGFLVYKRVKQTYIVYMKSICDMVFIRRIFYYYYISRIWTWRRETTARAQNRALVMVIYYLVYIISYGRMHA